MAFVPESLQCSAKIQGADHVDVARSSGCVLQVRRAAIEVFGQTVDHRSRCSTLPNASMKLTKQGRCKVAHVKCAASVTGGKKLHQGVMMEGEFTATVPGSDPHTFRYCLLHVLSNPECHARPMVGVFLTNDVGKATAAVKEPLEDGTTGALEVTIDESKEPCVPDFTALSEELRLLLGRDFQASTASAVHMALTDEASHANCVIAATRLLATLRGRSPDKAVQNAITLHRGRMLTIMAGPKFVDKTEVSCTDAYWWADLEDYTSRKWGTRYKLQVHKAQGKTGGTIVKRYRRTMPHSIHDKDYRIILRRPGAGTVWNTWQFGYVDRWTHKACSDSLEDLRKTVWSQVLADKVE